MAHKWATWLHNPCGVWGPHRFKAEGRIRGGPQVGKVAIYPLLPGGSPCFTSEGRSRNAHEWAVWLHGPYRLGVRIASERGAKSEVAHEWARWLHNPCRLWGPLRLTAGGRIRVGPPVGKVAT